MPNRRIWMTLSSLALIFSAGSAFAANSLDVNGKAALFGNFGLEVLIDGSSNQAYVEDLTPDQETAYRAEVKFNPGSLSMQEGEYFMIFMGRGRNTGTGQVLNMIRLAVVRLNNEFRVVCRIKVDGVGTAYCGKIVLSSTNNTRIGFEWVTSSAPGANDGQFRLLRNGEVKFERLDYDNDQLVINAARLGVALANRTAGTSGSFYLDDFASFRTLAP